MLIELLSLILGVLDSRARFMLAAFYLRYEYTNTGPLTIDELAGCLGVPTTECAVALSVLLKDSVLIASAESGVRVGRPKKSFRLHDSVAMKLQLGRAVSRPLIAAPYLGVVERLIRGPYIYATKPDEEIHVVPAKPARVNQERGAVPNRTSLLSRSNRLLLAMLFAHADRFGVVGSLGNVELCRLAGLEQTSLKQRIKKLVEMGFIRRHVPGVASPIFSEKLKSSYVLNLNHQQITSGADMIGFVVHEGADETGDVRFLEGAWFDLELWRSPAVRHRPSLSDLSTPASVLRLFRRAPKHAMEQLEFFLSGCVTDLLTQHWNQVGVVKSHFYLGTRDLISAFFRKPMRDVKDGSLLDEAEIVDFLWWITIQFAQECKVRFSQIEGLTWPGLNFRLLPADLLQGYAVLGMLIDGGGSGGGWQLKKVGDDAELTQITAEALCPAELRYKAGLLTPSRAKTV